VMNLTIRKIKSWFWLPTFYKYVEITDVRKWDIHWLCFVLINKQKDSHDKR